MARERNTDVVVDDHDSEETNVDLTDQPAEEQLVTIEQVREMFASTGLDRVARQRELGVINPIMLARALDVRPQMIYNYIRNGKITAVKENNTQKMFIEADEADRFAREYLERKARRQAKVEAELRGE